MLQPLIDRYRRRQKEALLRGPGQYRQGYAFVGVGSHSLQNLYPVVQHLGLPLRWIHSRTLAHAQMQARRFQGARATSSLDDILRDPEVKGVLLCAPAAVQHGMAMQCLEAGKHLWVEKPAAPHLEGLEKMIALAGGKGLHACMGVQRRHAPAVALLRSRIRRPQHYTLRYLAGAYPEGDVLTELFVHPLDMAVFLFGEVREQQVMRIPGAGGVTLLVQVEHVNGVKGQLELSTLHDWSRSEEVLTVNTAAGLWTLENLSRLTWEPYAARPLGIPLEKVLGRPTVTETHFEASRFLPQMAHQPLLVHGFHDALRSFADAVEGRQATLHQELREMRGVYGWMGRLKG